jgi:hypothetical protein
MRLGTKQRHLETGGSAVDDTEELHIAPSGEGGITRELQQYLDGCTDGCCHAALLLDRGEHLSS